MTASDYTVQTQELAQVLRVWTKTIHGPVPDYEPYFLFTYILTYVNLRLTLCLAYALTRLHEGNSFYLQFNVSPSTAAS